MPLHAVADRQVDQAVLDQRAPSVGALFRNRVQATPDKPAYLYFKDGDYPAASYTSFQMARKLYCNIKITEIVNKQL